MSFQFPGDDDKKETSHSQEQGPEKTETPATQEDKVETDGDGGGRGTPSVPDPGRKG